MMYEYVSCRDFLQVAAFNKTKKWYKALEQVIVVVVSLRHKCICDNHNIM